MRKIASPKSFGYQSIPSPPVVRKPWPSAYGTKAPGPAWSHLSNDAGPPVSVPSRSVVKPSSLVGLGPAAEASDADVSAHKTAVASATDLMKRPDMNPPLRIERRHARVAAVFPVLRRSRGICQAEHEGRL